MKLQPPSAPLDSFFAPVRRRHPDVDLVVLPAPEPRPSSGTLDQAQVVETLERVTRTAERLGEAVLGSSSTPPAGLGFGPDDGTVVASARGSTTTPDGLAALVALRGALEREGWRTRRVPGEVERLSATRGEVRVEASYAEGTGALLLDVRSEPLYVGRPRARELVRR